MYDSISNTSIPTEHEQQATEIQNQREIEYQKYLNKKHAIFGAIYDWNTPRYVWWNADIQA